MPVAPAIQNESHACLIEAPECISWIAVLGSKQLHLRMQHSRMHQKSPQSSIDPLSHHTAAELWVSAGVLVTNAMRTLGYSIV